MIGRLSGSTPTDTLFPYTTLFRSRLRTCAKMCDRGARGSSRRLPERRRVAEASAGGEHFGGLGDGRGVDAEMALQVGDSPGLARSEEHTSELQSLMRISYAVFCL